MNNIGFIGVGYMGYGIAKNILNKGNNLFVIANKNREPIEKIVNEGANEVKTLEEFKEKKLNVLVKCVTNTPIAKEIASKLSGGVEVHKLTKKVRDAVVASLTRDLTQRWAENPHTGTKRRRIGQ